jgi:thiol-disulfide isomerase/thioredoxin
VCGLVAIASATGDDGRMPDFDGATGWLNSASLSTKSLRGKVVLVNFWTYSCINSLRELPYIKAWAAKYKDAGLVVIGVHTPEFGFEKDPADVKNAVSDLHVSFPVLMDSDSSIWSAFRNNYRPADYFIDRNWRIRHHHYGEGDYAESEGGIQKLLNENGPSEKMSGTVHITGVGIEAPPNDDVQSPETYAGYARTEHFLSRQRMVRDSQQAYILPLMSFLNGWGLGGLWKTGPEHDVLVTAPGKVLYRFHARDLHMVLGPAKDGRPIRFKVTLDGAATADDHGIRQQGRVQDRTFEIEFLDPGVQVFSFTFG